MSVDSKHWGPGLWDFMYSMAHIYDPENKDNVNKFLIDLQNVLPCEVCQKHYKEYIEKTPPDLIDKTTFQKWINDLHNTIRKQSSQNEISIEQINRKFITFSPSSETVSPPKIIQKSAPSFSIQKTPKVQRNIPKGVNGYTVKRKGCGCGGKKR